MSEPARLALRLRHRALPRHPLLPAPRVHMRSSGLSPTELRQRRSSRSMRASGAFFPGASSVGGGPPRAVKAAERSRQIWSPPPRDRSRQKVVARVPCRQVLLPIEDLAFAIARFYQRGGTFQNYYMVTRVLLHFQCPSPASTVPTACRRQQPPRPRTSGGGVKFLRELELRFTRGREVAAIHVRERKRGERLRRGASLIPFFQTSLRELVDGE
jgi:hypothetical protein